MIAFFLCFRLTHEKHFFTDTLCAQKNQRLSKRYQPKISNRFSTSKSFGNVIFLIGIFTDLSSNTHPMPFENVRSFVLTMWIINYVSQLFWKFWKSWYKNCINVNELNMKGLCFGHQDKAPGPEGHQYIIICKRASNVQK